MVAYSFQKRFVEPIRARTKRQTIRRRGLRRHARPGELVQLYCGMRTKHCFKILEPDPVCQSAEPIRLSVSDESDLDIWREIATEGGETRTVDLATEAFAKADGFASLTDMARFWLKAHGPGTYDDLVLVRWAEAAEGG
ncbi:MAG: ASCH domain-containing protein [Hyphomicrobiales bacterium]|nr:ASCH domain-containing protein [Hyphomicrobiales bacterium]